MGGFDLIRQSPQTRTHQVPKCPQHFSTLTNTMSDQYPSNVDKRYSNINYIHGDQFNIAFPNHHHEGQGKLAALWPGRLGGKPASIIFCSIQASSPGIESHLHGPMDAERMPP
jgi:hypothetical protein